MCFAEPLVQAVVCRLQQLLVLLCLLQQHVFACTVIVRLIYSRTVQMRCRSLQQLLGKSPLLCHLHHPVNVSSQDDL